jgi:predicted dehydrogenase
MSKTRSPLSRRRFVQGTGAAAALTFAPNAFLTGGPRSPGEKLNVAFIGVGGRGEANLSGLSDGNNVVALCDLDDRRAAGAFQRFPGAKKYRDFRKMLDEMGKSIDAVAISTPDHTHAVAAMEAIRRGLHVYCEKPLAHSVHEVRALMKAAREKGVVTQLGNQGHSSETIRRCVEWVRAGAIGRVHTVHASCSAVHCKVKELPLLSEKPPVPADLDWDLWLGPALERPYHPAYLPGKWRGWKPFGNGTIGDWVCHVVDPAFWALDLGAPRTVEAVRIGDYDPRAHADTFPAGCTIKFEFPAKGERGAVTLYWYSGLDASLKPRPKELEAGREVPTTGAILVGEGGEIMHGSHGAGGVKIVPEEKMKAYKQPSPSIPRVGNHHKDFVTAILEKRKAGSDFAEYGGPLTEIAMLGIIAMNFPQRKLTWDSENARFTDCDEANRFVNPPYREGWSL